MQQSEQFLKMRYHVQVGTATSRCHPLSPMYPEEHPGREGVHRLAWVRATRCSQDLKT